MSINVQDSKLDLELLRRQVAALRQASGKSLAASGGGGHNGDMDERVTRLEVEFEHARKDLDEIKSDLKSVLGILSRVPTTSNLWTMVATVLGLAVAMIGTFIGVLAYVGTLPRP